jgi:hypothetical protein
MFLLVTYLAMTIVGCFIIYLIGVAIEQVLPAASLPVFLVLFFSMLAVAWIASVKITAPKQPAA